MGVYDSHVRAGVSTSTVYVTTVVSRGTDYSGIVTCVPSITVDIAVVTRWTSNFGILACVPTITVDCTYVSSGTC